MKSKINYRGDHTLQKEARTIQCRKARGRWRRFLELKLELLDVQGGQERFREVDSAIILPPRGGVADAL